MCQSFFDLGLGTIGWRLCLLVAVSFHGASYLPQILAWIRLGGFVKDLCECNSFVLFLQQCPVTMCSGRREEECVSWEYYQPQAGLMRLLGCIANFAPLGRLASSFSAPVEL